MVDLTLQEWPEWGGPLMLDALLSQLANGLVLGFLYILIAIGLSIIFGLLGIVNFAHGAFFALGAYFAVTFVGLAGWPAVILAPFAVAAVSVVCELVLIRRLYREGPLLGLIVTFALALLIEAFIRTFWGSMGIPMSPPAFLAGLVEFGPVLLTSYRLAILVITVLILALMWVFFTFTPYGRILRAGSRDPEMLAFLGVNFPRVMTGAFALGCFLAGTAGALAGPLWSVSPSMSSAASMPAFVIVTIGGLGSYKGAVVAGLLVGVVTALAVQFAPESSGIAMYLLMAAVLLLRPRGLFGEAWERFE
jgi:branched-chain amino acid transport system permease protein